MCGIQLCAEFSSNGIGLAIDHTSGSRGSGYRNECEMNELWRDRAGSMCDHGMRDVIYPDDVNREVIVSGYDAKRWLAYENLWSDITGIWRSSKVMLPGISVRSHVVPGYLCKVMLSRVSVESDVIHVIRGYPEVTVVHRFRLMSHWMVMNAGLCRFFGLCQSYHETMKDQELFLYQIFFIWSTK